MRLDSVDLHLVNIECMPGSTKLNAILDLQQDIEDLLPYLAAEIQGCTYIHGTGELNYMDRGHIVAITPSQIRVTAVRDEAEARGFCDKLRALINDVDCRRSSIIPVLHKQARLGPLAVYRQLPGSNCGECGERTCMAFAARVVNRELPASRCTQLLLEGYRDNRQRLWEVLKEAEYDPE
jgi:ArsR family metal-binding transcriptional regulator